MGLNKLSVILYVPTVEFLFPQKRSGCLNNFIYEQLQCMFLCVFLNYSQTNTSTLDTMQDFCKGSM